MALALLGILTVCPLMACGLMPDSVAASEQCCHHPPKSYPQNTFQKCPYLLLEQGKTATATAQVLSVALDPVSPGLGVSDAYHFIRSESRISDSQGLYLRIHVLRI